MHQRKCVVTVLINQSSSRLLHLIGALGVVILCVFAVLFVLLRGKICQSRAAASQKVALDVEQFVSQRPPLLDVASKGSALREAYIRLYSQNQYLRDAMFKIITASIAAMGACDGWLVARTTSIPKMTRIVITVADVLIGVLASYAALAHYREYVANAAMIVRIERALGFYFRGAYMQDSIYEPVSSRWGAGVYSYHILRSYLVAVLAIAAFSIALVWFL